ncbi:hypothetical protein KIL84_017554 [Mauremys mutica]|uniref:Uncharacterized protein n=1 Tax=Mauremys mutica TaxID=74926 RepID=A0A9D4AYR8_9SAUR|nr:hypothetical protein KIL84_017554 [Mauremys mutica]
MAADAKLEQPWAVPAWAGAALRPLRSGQSERVNSPGCPCVGQAAESLLGQLVALAASRQEVGTTGGVVRVGPSHCQPCSRNVPSLPCQRPGATGSCPGSPGLGLSHVGLSAPAGSHTHWGQPLGFPTSRDQTSEPSAPLGHASS